MPPPEPTPPSVPEPPQQMETPEAGAAGPLAGLVTAHLRRVEVAMLARVLISTLSAALPASMIRVERRRSLLRRLAGRAGEPVGVTITAGDRTLSFRAPAIGVTEASVGHTVRGVLLSSTQVPVSQWLDELGALLDHVTRDDEAARTALERAVLS